MSHRYRQCLSGTHITTYFPQRERSNQRSVRGVGDRCIGHKAVQDTASHAFVLAHRKVTNSIWKESRLMTQYTDSDMTPELVAQTQDRLKLYAGSNTFLLDVRNKMLQYNWLTIPQARAVANAFEREDHPVSVEAPVIRDGKYTVIFNEEGDDYVTLRLSTPNHGSFKDKQIASYLNGPDNNRNYKGFAFTNGKSFNTWRAYAEPQQIKRQKIALALLLTDNDPGLFGYNYSLQSGNCFICGRTLTVPASLHRGMGPICAANTGAID